MKPLYLEFCGINSFSEPAKIDFTKLFEYGLFGIFGDTGSGKSTILDCVGFALYGNVSRARSGSIVEIINFNSDRAYVIFEFEIVYEGKRRKFRVERELKRKNASQTVKVYEKAGDSFRAFSDGVRESNTLLEKMIGLEQKDFEKCIALPQGEFAQFVKAQRSDRLKLVSRLFNLEEYGEKLVKKANARCAKFTEERNLLLARLEPYKEVTREKIESFKEELHTLSERETAGRILLEAAREAELKGAELLKKKKRAEEIRARIAFLEERKSEISVLERELCSIERAQEAVDFEREADSIRKELNLAQDALRKASNIKKKAEESVARYASFDEEAVDEKISYLTEQKTRAEQAEERERKRSSLKQSLDLSRIAYAEEAARMRDFCYESEKEQILNRLAELKEGDFLSFAEEHGKSALLHAEYSVFLKELQEIRTLYPETEEKILPLIKKYTDLSQGDRINFAQIKVAFEERERERKQENENLIALEKKNGLYRAHRERLLQLQSDGLRMKEELAALGEAPKGGEPSKSELERALNELKIYKRTTLLARENARRESASAAAEFAAAEEKLRAAASRVDVQEARIAEILRRGGFSSAEEASALLKRFGGSNAKERVEQFHEEYNALSGTFREIEKEGVDLSVTEESVNVQKETRIALEKEREELVKSIALKKDQLLRGEEALARKAALEKELKTVSENVDISERLKKLLEGNHFMEYVAEEYLQNVAQNGSGRLLKLTEGRYFLRYNGGFFVGDNLAGGALRSVSTLSGGETFLVSLSLALALSAEICFKSLRPIEFFFLDEGFGTLDGHLVDVVMDSLEKLKGEHFTIGVISHVEELKNRIGRKLLVKKATDQHGSQIEMD